MLFAGMVAGLMLLFSLTIYGLSANYRKEEYFGRLRDRASITGRLISKFGHTLTDENREIIEEESSLGLIDERLTVYNAAGQVIYNLGGPPQPLEPSIFTEFSADPEDEARFKESNGREVLYLRHKDRRGTLVVVASAMDRYGLRKIEFLVLILSIGWLAMVAVCVVAGWFFSRNALKPINDVIRQVEQIDPASLDSRQRVHAGKEEDEIALLARAFNQMLDRVKNSFDIQRSFVGNASHEIRTPLTVMKGQIDVALLQDRPAEEYRRLLESLREDVAGMTALANDLLELARANSDVSSLPFHMARVDEVVLQAESDLMKKHPSFRVVVNYAEAPEDETAYSLRVNERLLKNAFFNLMENACKFSPDNTVHVNMFIRRQDIRLEFTDHGPGIPKSDHRAIFEPFYRAEDARKQPGHGIGLPLVKRILDLHGSAIEVRSALGKGTTFTVVLPRRTRTDGFLAPAA